MKRVVGLYDKLVIYICCLIAYFFQAGFETSITTILLGLIVSCFLSYFDNSKTKVVLTVCFIISTFFVSGLVFFIPLIFFDVIIDKHKFISLLFIIPLVEQLREGSLQAFVSVLILLVLSTLIAYRVEQIKKMNDKHNDLIDTARELSIKLEKQNSDLIEKQDGEVYMAALNERNRIAREIHDNVGHLLSSSILQAGALKIINHDDKIVSNINTLNETLTKAMNSIRDSVHELYDESIDLNESISELVEKFSFCEINYRYNIFSNPDKKLKYAFVAMIKEAFTNIVKHSNATEVNIIVAEHPALYQLIIRDNGSVKNFQPDEGLGLKNMVDRVNSFNGNININTDKGFEIFITIPKGVQGR